MATRFDFNSSYPSTAVQLERANLTTGGVPESARASWFNAVSPAQSIESFGGVDVFAVTLVQGQRYDFDIDSAQLNLQIDIIDQAGRLVKTADGADFNALIESWSPSKTGEYYIAIRHADNEYTGNFNWQRDTYQEGSYQFRFSASPDSAYMASASRSWNLSDSAQNYYFTELTDEVRGNGGSDRLDLLGGNDIALGGTGNDTVFGGAGMDDLMGDSGNDMIFGGTGSDVLRGGSNDDRLFGDSGNDGLLGGSGNDMLRGGTGVDILTGGTGADTFRFVNGESNASSTNSPDYLDSVQDFSRSQGDRIDLRYAYGDDDSGFLSWRGTGSFTASNQVRAEGAGSGYVLVQVNLDSDSSAEMEFLVRPTSGTIGGSDFLL